MKAERTVVVSGDVMVDWNIALRAGEVSLSREPGGAALLGELLTAMATRWDVRTVRLPAGDIDPSLARVHHTYSLLDSFDSNIWRVKGFLGKQRAGGPLGAKAKSEGANAALVVLDDLDLGFRNAPGAWPRSIVSDRRQPRIILKSCAPLAAGSLWQHLLKKHAQRLIVITTVDDLRQMEVHVSRSLSWERAAQDLVWEVHRSPLLRGLGSCANVIVSFGTAGAVVLSGGRNGDARLVFDAGSMEGECEPPGKGRTVGNTTILAAAVARELMRRKKPDLVNAVRCGIAGMRAFYAEGYGRSANAAEFPFERIAAAMKTGTGLPVVTIGSPERRSAVPGGWTILDEQVHDDLSQVAVSVAVEGPKRSLASVPRLEIGDYIVVDRGEIESLRVIKRLLSEYASRRPSQPLSIAVFGPPGSGKSFGVKKIAKSLQGEIEMRTFNLSQFARPEDLHGAMHQVRDISLSGKLPIVFWDEFDTPLGGDALGWLRYFLAPMQDGSFVEGQLTHPIGTAVFVFAGGTSPDMKSFGEQLSEDDRKKLKVPDFVSRLKGFLNVLGPNRLADGDRFYVVRRAILLRSLLKDKCSQLFDGNDVLQIDPGVLRAFLQTTLYKHGARSMEAIVLMSALSGKTRFERSSLPAETELRLHVHGREFIALVHQLEIEPVVDDLARATHDVFREGKRRDGWTLGPRDEAKRTHPLLVPWEQLPPAFKESNRRAARTIPLKLAVIGHVMTPARSGGPQAVLSADEIERVAQLEHELWMTAQRATGPHQHIVPWDKLPDPIKQIDRDLAAGMIPILTQAGYTIVRIEDL
jgi:hypothetical protein